MSSQGAASTKSGQQLQEKWLDILRQQDIKAYSEYLTGIPNALADDKTLRCDIYLPDEDIIIECKNHSGQPGTLFQKIPYSFLTYRKTRTPVVFLLGENFMRHPYQVRALERAAELVSPLITVIVELEIEQLQRTSTQPKSVFSRLVSDRPALGDAAAAGCAV